MTPFAARAAAFAAAGVALVSSDAWAQRVGEAHDGLVTNVRMFTLSSAFGGAYALDGSDPAFQGRVGLIGASFEPKGARLDALTFVGLGSTGAGMEGFGFDGEVAGIEELLFGHPEATPANPTGSGVCAPAVAIVAGGDCAENSGHVGLGGTLLRGILRPTGWAVRWAEARVVVDPIRNRFGHDFFHLRLPLSVGLGVDTLFPSGPTPIQTVVRAAAVAGLLWRDRTVAWEFDARVAVRPAVDDWRDVGVESRVGLSRLFCVRVQRAGNLARLGIELSHAYWSDPSRSLADPRDAAFGHTVRASLNFELSLYHVVMSGNPTPSGC